jgi:DNA (cytosine-5)-methyltransferase 1
VTPAQRLDAARQQLDQPAPPPVPGQLGIDVPAGPRIGSWCSGYRGLDMAVERVFGGTTTWVSDIDPGANKILAHHWPTTPNLGDLTTTDWQAVVNEYGPVDIVCGGYPCQPFSTAGLRKGTEDERHIWPYIADALRILRPRVAIFENVAGHLRLGFDTVLADLAALGFDAEWALVRASEVGAPHRRERLFILATAQDADGKLGDQRRFAAPGQAEGRGAWTDARRRGGTPATHAVGEHEWPVAAGNPRRESKEPLGSSRRTPADAARLGRGERWSEPAGQQGRSDAVLGSGAALADADTGRRGADERHVRPGQPDADWGRFAPAVARWEHATGRRAPRATDDRNRLSPAFVEWLMGLPGGHVTHVPGLTRTQQLKALGNGVVPQQAEAAIRLLAARALVPA